MKTIGLIFPEKKTSKKPPAEQKKNGAGKL